MDCICVGIKRYNVEALLPSVMYDYECVHWIQLKVAARSTLQDSMRHPVNSSWHAS